MDELAPAKINLALHILGRRHDGYHELDSVVAFADIADRLTIDEAETTSLEVTGPFSAALDLHADNLVLKAHGLLAEQGRVSGFDVPNFHFRLQKNLPVAAGIGGGSADAAAALRLMIRRLELALPDELLMSLALRLGADVPVCLGSVGCRMRGIGETLEPVSLGGIKAAVLVNPGVKISTAAVFSQLALSPGQKHGEALIVDDPASWGNDLQEPAFALVPEIAEVVNLLTDEPAVTTARMSGSGATCFGLTEDTNSAARVAARLERLRPSWWIRQVSLS